MSAYIYEKLEKVKDGKKLKITIQQVTPDLIERVIQHMSDNYVSREPLCRHTKLQNDPVSLESGILLWRKSMEEGAAIVAMLDQGPEKEPKVIGANITVISRKGDPPVELPGEAYKNVIGVVKQLMEEANIWEAYGVNSCLIALGLSVDKNYHGMNLGADILRARKKVCDKFDIPMTATAFTTLTAQHLAAKVGFETIIEYPYKDFNFILSNVFRDLDGKVNVMIKKYK